MSSQATRQPDLIEQLEYLVRANLPTLPELPRYTDDENRDFHPVAFAAAELALSVDTRTDDYRAQPQYATPAGPADMVIIDSASDPWVPVEIKKHRSDVRGKGRRQANDYRDNLSRRRTELYVSTNLELFEVFLFDSGRPSVAAQLLLTEFREVGTLATARTSEAEKLQFYVRLTAAFCELMSIALDPHTAVYDNSLYGLTTALDRSFDDADAWHQQLLPVSFDIVRASRRFRQTDGWQPSAYYRQSPRRLIDLGQRIDFEPIFSPPAPASNDATAFDPVTAQAVAQRASDPTMPLEIAGIVYDQITRRKRYAGIVETDPDLARLLARLARGHLLHPLRAHDRVLDPCAATGALLVGFAETSPSGEQLRPEQLAAIEIEPRFAEALSLRVGIACSHGLSPTNHPQITISDFTQVEKQTLQNVRLVLVNPPFQSRARSLSSDATAFGRFVTAIDEETNGRGQLTGGQHGLEKLFLELLVLRAEPGTTIAAIIPKKLLTAPGRDGDAFRKFLLNSFGLRQIATYPSADLFSDYKVETAVVIGRVPFIIEHDWQIEASQLLQPVPELRDSPLLPGVNSLTETTSRSELADRLADWRVVLMPKVSAALEQIEHVAPDRLQVHRGSYGNRGLSGELAFDSAANAARFGVAARPLQRSGAPPRLLGGETASEWTIGAEDAANMTPDQLALLWQTVQPRARADGPQKKGEKIASDLPAVLSQHRVTANCAILIPRAQRAAGQISVFAPTALHPTVVVSTNYLIAEQANLHDAKVRASWLLSVFGQIMLEHLSKPERGMRKLEMTALPRIAIPDLTRLSAVVKAELASGFEDAPEIKFGPDEERRPSEIDRLWADALFGSAGSGAGTGLTSEQVLELAYDALEELLRDRHQGR